jgi:hypothetical protein
MQSELENKKPADLHKTPDSPNIDFKILRIFSQKYGYMYAYMHVFTYVYI